MERVQFQQEQMLAELKDLVDKDIFTTAETKAIMKKRTQFETALVRRVAKKADFLRYAAYEMGLEQLRRKRVQRLKIATGPATVSDYALVRRQFNIFEHALRRFKSDVGLWIQYIELAKREGAHTLAGRVVARAIQMHPSVPGLYVLAANHELAGGSPSAARTLLQRGLRLCGDSVELWREWVRMELGFVQSLRRRWGVLGLVETKGKEREQGSDHVGQDGLATEDEGEEARAAIMAGRIVEEVIASAAQALGTTELFSQLIEVIHAFPLPDGGALSAQLLEQVYRLLRAACPRDPRAARLLADRFLPEKLQGEALVAGVQAANEEMLALCEQDGGDAMFRAYLLFVEDTATLVMDDALKLYLVSSARALIGASASASLVSELAGLRARVGV